MAYDIVILVLSLAIILLSCELFTNGIEWLGKALKMGDGVVGSIFSAVGTCLPETMVPIIAIITALGVEKAESVENLGHIGIGAIVGAPFMLSTLAFFVTGLSAVLFWKRRGTGKKMLVNNDILRRDIGFFIITYGVGILASFLFVFLNENAPFVEKVVRILFGIVLLGAYGYYVVRTVQNDNPAHVDLEPLYLAKIAKSKTNLTFIIVQIAIALLGIVFGANLFVQRIESFSSLLGVSALALSLVITPIATELPEKFNSILWIRKKKDTLALGNITGAMVFQSCIPVALGIVATAWKPDFLVLLSATCAIASGIFTYFWLKIKKELTIVPLLAGGLFYSIFLGYLISNGFK
jgi:cation:H+ antiporter